MTNGEITALANDAMRKFGAAASVSVTSEPHPLGTEFLVSVYWASTQDPSRLLGLTQAFVVPLSADGRVDDAIVREIMNSAAETERKDDR